MAIYDEKVKVSKKEDGSFTISIAINDSSVYTKKIDRASAELLHIQLENLLK